MTGFCCIIFMFFFSVCFFIFHSVKTFSACCSKNPNPMRVTNDKADVESFEKGIFCISEIVWSVDW